MPPLTFELVPGRCFGSHDTPLCVFTPFTDCRPKDAELRVPNWSVKFGFLKCHRLPWFSLSVGLRFFLP